MSPATAWLIGRSVAPSGRVQMPDALVGVVVGVPAVGAAVTAHVDGRVRAIVPANSRTSDTRPA